jgi:homoserine kinase
LFEATEDKLHQNYRAEAMPETNKVVMALRAAGFAAVVSGAGPSVLVLCSDPSQRQAAIDLVAKVQETPWTPLILAVDFKGATVETSSSDG